ncbi:AMP-binding protein [Lipingzhangella sp. LS1_29]|uniref:AMP-binding protein n=1 Tax=Lipingzhangella rawalii TaxID=2055835 RepID=A0ABU2H2C5_9ACTN|nr:AMP-binding protein [Lipingzhangella rawalii]MDS1269147.1 AMP-binding protein [Lipingzhangella rawalii]
MGDPAQQVRDWLDSYDTPHACVATLLCDRHPPDTVALTEVDADMRTRDLTYGELATRSRRLASGLADLGVGPGVRVATLMSTGHDLVVTMLAIWRLGAVSVPLFTALAPSAIAHRLDHSATHVVVCDAEHREKITAAGITATETRIVVAARQRSCPDEVLLSELEQAPRAETPPVAVGGTAPFILLYTPGPVGYPRAVPVPVRALAAFHAYLVYGLDVDGDDVYWNTTDPGWSYGLYFGVVAPLLAGAGTVQLRAGFDAELTLDVLASLGVTNLAAAPTVYRALRASVKSLPPEVAPRRLSSAGEPLTPDVAAWAQDVFGVPIRDHYGQPELGICLGAGNHPEVAVEPAPGSAGIPLPGWRVGVIEPGTETEAAPGDLGQVAVDVPNSPLAWFTGYAEPARGDVTAVQRFSPSGRWYITGDTGRCDTSGQVYLASRDHDVIVTSGYRVSPFEVESLLLGHPAVLEAAVYGLADEIAGQLVAVKVVLQQGWSASVELEEQLRSVVRRGVGEHAEPRQVDVVTRLPRNASGKIQRGRVRRL